MHKTDFSAAAIAQMMAGVPNWYHRIELAPGIITPGVNNTPVYLQRLEALGFPQDFSGLRVLDIGCADGFFSFEAEKRGAAQVVAVDYRKPTNSGFSVAREILGSSVEYHADNVYGLTPEKYGTFDVIFFLGLIYHVRNPLQAFDLIRQMSKPNGLLFVESQIMDQHLVMADGHVRTLASLSPQLVEIPLWQFYGEKTGQRASTNKWVPNMAGLREIIEEAQFEIIRDAAYKERGMALAKAVDDSKRELRRQLDESSGV